MSDEPDEEESKQLVPLEEALRFDPLKAHEFGHLIVESRTEGVQTPTLDLQKHQLTVQLEIHRIEEEKAQKKHERRKDWITFCVVVGALVGGLILGGALIVFSTDPEMRRWGQSLIILIIGALGGYITGSKTSS